MASMTALSPAWKTEYQELRRQIEAEALWGGIALLVVIAAVVMFWVEPVYSPYGASLVALLGYASAGISLLLKRRAGRLSAAVLVTGLFGMSILLIRAAGVAEGVYLLPLAVGFVTLYSGPRWGAGLAVACALGVTKTAFWQAETAVQPALVILLCAVVVALVWLPLRALRNIINWAWTGYQTSLESLEQVRSSQGKLQESLENLREANAQLLRLGQLAQNLRVTAEEERLAKETFVANVSHELRTPLNMIIGFCGMILQTPETYGPPLPPKLMVDLEIIYRNSQHLSSLIDDVLDLSQIDAGRMALVKERANITEVIAEAVTAVQPLYSSKGLYLQVETGADLPQVWCDRTRIREVLMNLLSNAGRFTEHGGITLRAAQKGGALLVSVADTGPGMTEEERSRLFRPFEQLDSSIRRRYGGTGLGLSISKSFIEMHDGRIWVESQKNLGTTFFFQLPLDPASAVGSSAARWLSPYSLAHEERRHYHMEPGNRPKPRVLVVEQGNGLQKLLARYVPALDVAHVPTLEDALARMEPENGMALLVNDPAVSQALDRVRESGGLPQGIPAIACSLASELQASEELGVHDYLVKPVQREALLASIAQLGRPVQNILVVDDEPDARQLFKRMLDSAGKGYQVIRAEDGEFALEMLRSRPVDLMVMDLTMPNLDGFQLLAAKNAVPAWKDIPVILVSARDPYGQPITSSALGVTCSSGLSTRQVLACIEALMAILSPLGPAAQADRAAPLA